MKSVLLPRVKIAVDTLKEGKTPGTGQVTLTFEIDIPVFTTIEQCQEPEKQVASYDGLENTEEWALTLQLSSPDTELLEKTLVTIGNYAAFTNKQNLFRKVGCLPKLKALLEKYRMAMKLGGGIPHPKVVNGIASAINNLAMNTENQQQLQGCIPALIEFANCEKSSSLQLTSLQALTNLSVTSQYHAPYTQLIQQLYDLLDTGSHNHRLQSLKIVSNLSCNTDMVPHLLAARAPKCTLEMLSPDCITSHLLRWTTILANILSTSQDKGITSTTLPCEYKAASPETLHATLYGVDNHAKLKSKVFLLCKHEDEDIRNQASRIHNCLT